MSKTIRKEKMLGFPMMYHTSRSGNKMMTDFRPHSRIPYIPSGLTLSVIQILTVTVRTPANVLTGDGTQGAKTGIILQKNSN